MDEQQRTAPEELAMTSAIPASYRAVQRRAAWRVTCYWFRIFLHCCWPALWPDPSRRLWRETA